MQTLDGKEINFNLEDVEAGVVWLEVEGLDEPLLLHDEDLTWLQAQLNKISQHILF